MRESSKYILAAIAWAAVIMVLCGIPGNDLPKLTFLQWLRPDKIVHLLMFGTLNYLLLKAFYILSMARFKMVATAITITYGLVTEILQAVIFIGRTGDFRDALANALGACCALWLFHYFRKRKTASA